LDCNGRNVNAESAINVSSFSTGWNNASGTLSGSIHAVAYRFTIAEAGNYDFSTGDCDGEGVNSDFDTWLCLYDESGVSIMDNDDECGLHSYLDFEGWVGIFYVVVSGYSSSYGDFVLSWRKDETTTTPEPTTTSTNTTPMASTTSPPVTTSMPATTTTNTTPMASTTSPPVTTQGPQGYQGYNGNGATTTTNTTSPASTTEGPY
jgi:hypothetical protein